MHYLFLSIAFSLNALANILLKYGAKNGGLKVSNKNPIIFFSDNYLFLAGLFCFAINVIFYFLALKNIPLSVAYPTMTIMSMIIVTTFAFFGFKESITNWQIMGYFMIISGLVLVFLEAGKDKF